MHVNVVYSRRRQLPNFMRIESSVELIITDNLHTNNIKMSILLTVYNNAAFTRLQYFCTFLKHLAVTTIQQCLFVSFIWLITRTSLWIIQRV